MRKKKCPVFILFLVCVLVLFGGCSVVKTDKAPTGTIIVSDEVEPPAKNVENIEWTPVVIDTETEKEEIPETVQEEDTDGAEPVANVPAYSVDELPQNGRELEFFGNFDNEDMRWLLKSILDGYYKRISLVCWSLDGANAIAYNTEARYHSGCTIKMPFFLYCCKAMDAGLESPDTVLTYMERHFTEGSGRIRYNAFGSQYTIAELITLGLSISDNVAYKMLYEHFGTEGYNEFIEELGCPSLTLTGMWPGRVSPVEFVKVWNEVKRYFESGAPNSELLREACTNTMFAYGMGAIDGVDYSHKSGHQYSPYEAYNDVGIVWCEHPFIYAVFTASEGEDYDDGVISQAVKCAYELINYQTE